MYSGFDGLAEKRLLLAIMHGLGTSRRAGGGAAAGVADLGTDCAFEAWRNIGPGPHVERLFLAPDKVRGVRVLADDRLDHLVVERIELFDTYEGGVFDALFLTMRHEVVVNLATAEDDTC